MIHVLDVEWLQRFFDRAFDGEGGGRPLMGWPFGAGVVAGIAVDWYDHVGSMIFG